MQLYNMIKNKLLTSILSISLLSTLITRTWAQSSIPWSPGVQLSWGDFQGTPNSSFWSFTSYEINYKYKWDGAGNLSYEISCGFLPAKSWKRTEKNLSMALLKHEQKHFDIAEVFARKLKQEFSNYAFSHKHSANTDADLNTIFHRILNENYALQDQYDSETNHSILAAKQEEWNLRITNLLNALSQYESR